MVNARIIVGEFGIGSQCLVCGHIDYSRELTDAHICLPYNMWPGEYEQWIKAGAPEITMDEFERIGLHGKCWKEAKNGNSK